MCAVSKLERFNASRFKDGGGGVFWSRRSVDTGGGRSFSFICWVCFFGLLILTEIFGEICTFSGEIFCSGFVVGDIVSSEVVRCVASVIVAACVSRLLGAVAIFLICEEMNDVFGCNWSLATFCMWLLAGDFLTATARGGGVLEVERGAEGCCNITALVLTKRFTELLSGSGGVDGGSTGLSSSTSLSLMTMQFLWLLLTSFFMLSLETVLRL